MVPLKGLKDAWKKGDIGERRVLLKKRKQKKEEKKKDEGWLLVEKKREGDYLFSN